MSHSGEDDSWSDQEQAGCLESGVRVDDGSENENEESESEVVERHVGGDHAGCLNGGH